MAALSKLFCTEFAQLKPTVIATIVVVAMVSSVDRFRAWPLPVDRNNSEMSFSDGGTPFVSATSPSYRPTARDDEWGACCSDTAEDSGSTETVDRTEDGGSTPRPQEEESQEEGEGR